MSTFDPFAPILPSEQQGRQRFELPKDVAFQQMLKTPPTRILLRGPIRSAKDWVESGMRVGVDSSNVRSIRYHAFSKRLYVEFVKGGMGYYYEVDPKTAVEFFLAPSLGVFLGKRLKRVFPWVPIRK